MYLLILLNTIWKINFFNFWSGVYNVLILKFIDDCFRYLNFICTLKIIVNLILIFIYAKIRFFLYSKCRLVWFLVFICSLVKIINWWVLGNYLWDSIYRREYLRWLTTTLCWWKLFIASRIFTHFSMMSWPSFIFV